MKKYLVFGLVLAVALPIAAFAAQGDVDPLAASASCVTINNNLRHGSRDASTGGDVSALQDFLSSNNLLQSQPTGYFGLATLAAVQSYQTSVGLTSSGYVGPLTRAQIRTQTCGGVGAPSQVTGCNSGSMYNFMTGRLCPGPVPPVTPTPGCNGGSIYNYMTGALCSNPVSSQPVSVQTNPPVMVGSPVPVSNGQPSITITSPNGGEAWIMGNNVSASWTFSNLVGNVSVYLQNSSGTLCHIGDSAVNNRTVTFYLSQSVLCGNGAYLTPGSYKVALFADNNNIKVDWVAKSVSAGYVNVTAPSQSQPSISDFRILNSTSQPTNTKIFSWTAANATGVELFFACQSGITAIDTISNQPISCGENDRTYVADGSISLSFSSTNNTPVNVIVSVAPELNNVAYGSGLKSIAVQIQPPSITDFRILNSSQPINTNTFSWTAANSNGVEFFFSCQSGISAVDTTSNTSVGCGENDRTYAADGSTALHFSSTNNVFTNVIASVVPKVNGVGYSSAIKNITVQVQPNY